MSETRRFFVDDLPPEGSSVALSDEVSRHARVLRLGEGDEIVLFDGSGREATARVDGLAPLRCTVSGVSVALPDAPAVHLVQAMPKGKKLDQIVRMTTELGVDAVHLAISERAISRPDASKIGGKLARLEKLAREASRQARRRTVPKIHPPASLVDVAKRASDDAIRLVFWEAASEFLPRELARGADVWVVVGPEGGLSHTEARELAASGYKPVRIGQTILRVQSAAPTALALVLDRVGRFG